MNQEDGMSIFERFAKWYVKFGDERDGSYASNEDSFALQFLGFFVKIALSVAIIYYIFLTFYSNISSFIIFSSWLITTILVSVIILMIFSFRFIHERLDNIEKRLKRDDNRDY